MKLTHLDCKNAKPEATTYKLTDGHGMFLEVRPNGARYWRMKYRYAGKEKLLALGVFPEVTLLEARDKRAEARKLLAESIDPMIVKKERKLTAFTNAANTFEVLAREWHDNWKQNKTEKHAAAVFSRFESDVFPQMQLKLFGLVDVLKSHLITLSKY